ncbi:uncharacterized protein BX663DRAFT_484191 [Cokeromyces recurvatus]|uniref:uncharacterized protein n=1 Tax=Cokeromyces recurvatus TaxID=90255 RepID=UPI00221F5F9B|nr:uncharacterized protein BX663DRAFT_484191 [Cokeromyces recurvatus]KAI7905723.1 hypothetical protein BX663DRAFT_484191 [Cokeromyces recurvatus]
MIPVLTTVQQVFKKLITREEGCLRLMNIGMKLQGTQNVIVKFLKNTLDSFPLNDLGEIIKEVDDLKSRYILPVLQSLFDDLYIENMVFFKITNENNAECKQKVFDVSHRRPNGQFRQKSERKNLVIIGYMEAKSESESKNHEACMARLSSPCHLWQKCNRYLRSEKHVIDSSNWAKLYFLFITKEK